MRTIWNGSISFGLVNIPVGMALATKPAARQSDVSFRMLHRECGTPIKNKRWCPEHDREVSNDEIVKGWEVAKGQFVIVDDADLEALQTADDTRTIEITRFVSLGEVDPIYFDRTYFLAPADAAAQRRPYVLLLEAMKETGMAAVGKFVRQGAEHFCLIRPKGDALALETLFLAEDVRSEAEIEEAVGEIAVNNAELELARQVIGSLVGEFDPAELESEYRRDLRALLEAKLAGEEIAVPAAAEEPTAPVVDLMEALRASVAEAQQASSPRPRRRKPPRRAARVARSQRASSARSVVLGHRPERLQLRLEERLVDLAVVDRDRLLHADLDHLLAIDPELLRQLLRREVVRHLTSPRTRKNPPRTLAQTGSVNRSSFLAGRNQRSCPPRSSITSQNSRRP